MQESIGGIFAVPHRRLEGENTLSMTMFTDLPSDLSEHLRIRETETGGAVFSIGEKYRYLLRRHLNDEGDGHLIFIMLNPSTADHTEDDQTIRRCKGFAERGRYEWLSVVNLFAWRSTKPEGLLSVDDPIGEYNDRIIKASLTTANRVIMAWGDHGSLLDRSDAVRELLKQSFHGAYHLGLTNKGEPRHPLFRPYKTTPIWDERTHPTTT